MKIAAATAPAAKAEVKSVKPTNQNEWRECVCFLGEVESKAFLWTRKHVVIVNVDNLLKGN